MTPVACSVALPQTFDIREKFTEETIPMKQTWHGHKGRSGYLTVKNSTEGGDQ